jgi:hypothetical protein
MCLPVPHRAAAATTDTNSFTAMFMSFQSKGHYNRHQPAVSTSPPHPYKPDASVYTWTAGWGNGNNDDPFHSRRNHAKSARTPAFRRMLIWCPTQVQQVKKLACVKKKVHPGLTTDTACDKCPSSDSNSFLVHVPMIGAIPVDGGVYHK